MNTRKLAMAVAAATMAAAPMAVQAAPTERAAAPLAEESELRGNLLWIVALVAVIIAAILLLDDGPKSP